MLSPVFGGNTANTEFEVLTGFSTKFLPQGSVPYQQYINKPYPSLARFLVDQKGYQAIAVHPYEKWFYDRDKVYLLLGFQRFIGINEFKNPELRGSFVADSEVSKKIINLTETASKPTFIFAVTMQNHGPYEANRYGSNSIKVRGNISDESVQTLETYTQGVNDADKSLEMLIEHFKKSKKPTVVVWFGDHLPFLGADYKGYRESGYLSSADPKKWDVKEKVNARSVPLLIWSNYNLPVKKLKILSSSFIAPYLMDYIGIRGAAYYNFLISVSESMPSLTSLVEVDSKGSAYDKTPDAFKQQERRYQLLQYDFMFGKGYSKEFIFGDDRRKSLK